jgi:hypothetical protein
VYNAFVGHQFLSQFTWRARYTGFNLCLVIVKYYGDQTARLAECRGGGVDDSGCGGRYTGTTSLHPFLVYNKIYEFSSVERTFSIYYVLILM